MHIAGKSCESVYKRLTGPRDTYLDRGRECASLTIPSLLMKEGSTATTRIQTPYQSVGSYGVNNLASKLMLSLFPPNTPFFKLAVDDFTLAELTGGDITQRAEVEKALSAIERAVVNELEGDGMRNALHECMRHLIVTGNYLLVLPADGNLKGYGLDRYVVTRDPNGNMKSVIIHEEFDPQTLEPELLMAVGYKNLDGQLDLGEQKKISVYTKYYIDQDELGKKRKWRTYQEINGMIVEGTEGTYPIDTPPLMALRWTAVTGEAYGRSHVEELFGDLMSLEGLHKALLDGAAASARMLVMVNPNGMTRKEQGAQADNGAVITGKMDDVTFLQVNKSADLQVASNMAQRIEQRISQSFVVEGSVIRDAERVTAEEIRMIAESLSKVLSGTMGQLSTDLQRPFVSRLMQRMQQQKRLPKLPDGVIEPQIVAGLEALGRGHDLTKYGQMIQILAPMGAEVMSYINVGDFIERTATSLGIDSDGLIKSAEQIQQEQQAAQEAAMSQMAAQEGIGALRDQAKMEAAQQG